MTVTTPERAATRQSRPASRYVGFTEFDHKTPARAGILLANLGTPDAPTAPALRRYLYEFFSDPRVFEFPRLPWLLLSRGIILNVRPRKSAALYAKIWTPEGSPLLVNSQRLCERFTEAVESRFGEAVPVALGMRYGNPSIPAALETLRQQNVRRLVIVALFPQYSATTTASIFDATMDVLKTWRWLPDVSFVTHYHDHPGYIEALANSIRTYWSTHSQPDRLLFSFHGIPKRYFESGDPYYCECQKTARLVAEALALPADRYGVSFQSLFGREEWLRPYTSDTLTEWARAGIGSVHTICPGFAADCLETLEEIAGENAELFRHAGGQQFGYIPALNDSPDHVAALADIALAALG